MRYDVYGKYVLIANNMESNVISGTVSVSESTKNLLETYYPEDYSYIFQKSVYLDQFDESIELSTVYPYNENFV